MSDTVRAVALGSEGYAIFVNGDAKTKKICRSPIAMLSAHSWDEDREWAERIVKAVNNHEPLVEFVRGEARDLSSGMSSCGCEYTDARKSCAVIAGPTP